ncbi:hypothetical protein DQW50_00840 [Halorubrum sp. 48-1-W]|uniref:hypothetical protein n=1 Tax=Halorubrum sp. 48-1-W TaxID=2249761 RepID=UPI000DCE17CC|nr:hypothetical protein [Halorubrum sp. 48-1-W]RAW46966.1 hypothetical protein DQW50_00840 [Halorubrum sp. 48-1-W]
MSEKSLTLLEVHLDEGAIRIGEHGLLGGGGSDEKPDVEGANEASDDEDASGGSLPCCGVSARSVGLALAVVALLAVLGVVAARVLGDDLEDATEIDELGT